MCELEQSADKIGAKAMEMKPLRGPGGFITDCEFKQVLFTKKQAKDFARRQLTKSKNLGCKKASVKDYGDKFVFTVW